MEQVWVAETWQAHGEGKRVVGVYDSREAAWDALRPEVETLYVRNGCLWGRPRDEERRWRPGEPWKPLVWALAQPMPVLGRAQPPGDASAAGGDGDDAR